MILVDTSVWVDHLRRGDGELERLLDAGEVLVHSLVIGELACGTLRNRARLLGDLMQLPFAPRATDDEALLFLERRQLMGRGLGFIDVHLLASLALSGGARLLTRDWRLAEAADPPRRQ